MAMRRCLTAIARHGAPLLSSTPHSFRPLTRLLSHRPSPIPQFLSPRFFSSKPKPPTHPPVDDLEDDDEDYEGSASDEDDEEGEMESDDDSVSRGPPSRVYTEEERIQEASAIGYEVIGPLQESDDVFKDYEPVFAVVQIGSHQFKVSNRDTIYTERLKHCDVNDKLILNKVMMLGSQTQTIIGRPILEDAAVHAVVEEHALDAKVIIFKKKRRKNYRRTKGHRQELTRLRITDIQGIEKPEIPPVEKKGKKSSSKKTENIAVAA